MTHLTLLPTFLWHISIKKDLNFSFGNQMVFTHLSILSAIWGKRLQFEGSELLGEFFACSSLAICLLPDEEDPKIAQLKVPQMQLFGNLGNCWCVVSSPVPKAFSQTQAFSYQYICCELRHCL